MVKKLDAIKIYGIVESGNTDLTTKNRTHGKSHFFQSYSILPELAIFPLPTSGRYKRYFLDD